MKGTTESTGTIEDEAIKLPPTAEELRDRLTKLGERLDERQPTNNYWPVLQFAVTYLAASALIELLSWKEAG